MKGPDPSDNQLPTEKGGYQTYKAAGKLVGKKAIITGGDSGIGRAIAILFAMEGADSFLVFLPEEQKDAEDTKEEVEKYGGKCYLYPTDIRKRENCQKAVDEAKSKLGDINILVNNAAYQNMTNSMDELTEYVITLSKHFSNYRTVTSLLTLPQEINGTSPSTPTSIPIFTWQSTASSTWAPGTQ